MSATSASQATCGFAFATVSAVFWISLLAGVVLPDIQIRQTFRRAECEVLASTVDQSYNPTYNCSGCENYAGTPNCKKAVTSIRQRDPGQCPVDSSQCVDSETCNMGFLCCHDQEFCATCTNCGMRCDAEGRNCHRNCTTSKCNCYRECLRYVMYRGCFMHIDRYYAARVSVQFTDTREQKHITQYAFEPVDELSTAVHTMEQYRAGESLSCWYDTTDNQSIRWDIALNYPALSFMYMFGILAAVGILIGIDDVCNDDPCDDCPCPCCWEWKRSEHSSNDVFRLIWGEIFFGLFLPLVVLLPSALGDLQPVAPVKQTLIFCTFFLVFMTPGIFTTITASRAGSAVSIIYYYVLIGIPLGIVLPCFQFHKDPTGFATGVVIYSAIAVTAVIGAKLAIDRLAWGRPTAFFPLVLSLNGFSSSVVVFGAVPAATAEEEEEEEKNRCPGDVELQRAVT